MLDTIQAFAWGHWRNYKKRHAG